jgi:LPS-assembly protein
MRKFIFLCLITISLFAEVKKESFELISGFVTSDGDIINAKDNVVVLYGDYYITAKRAKFDKAKEVLEFYEEVTMLQGEKTVGMSEYLFLDMKNDVRRFEPAFLQDRDSDLWVSSKRINVNQTTYQLEKPYVSSCNPEDPTWVIKATSSEYDSESKWMQLYNTTLYAQSVPIFYLPYFAFPNDKTRHSGLLIPQFGLSDDEGFYLAQPIYYAPSLWWDLEVTPQIRTDRGYGLYGTFRFVDSATSRGWIRTGFFDEQEAYASEKNLKHRSHQGIEARYERNGVFEHYFAEGEDSLFLELNLMNDIDYINLQTENTIYNSTHIQTSRLNYFFNTDNNYYGMYAKYFLDTSKQDNDDTLQLLPRLHYHHYNSELLTEKLSYSVDYKMNNNYRSIGLSANEYQLNIPLEYSWSLFDNYMNIQVSEKLFGSQITFYGTNAASFDDESSRYFRNTHQIDIFTDLIKPYEENIHTLQMQLSYIKPGREHRTGFYQKEKSGLSDDGVCSENSPCEFTNVRIEEEQVQAKVVQLLVDSESGSEKLYHALTQGYLVDGASGEKLGELENELRYSLDSRLTLYSDMFYAHKKAQIVKAIHTVSYQEDDVGISFSHIIEDRESSNSNYLHTNLWYNIDNYHLYGRYAYDFETDSARNWEIGLRKNLRCWGYSVKFRQNVYPILTQAGSSSFKENVIFFEVSFNPIGAYHYEQKNK